jgi:hypothetical protein
VHQDTPQLAKHLQKKKPEKSFSKSEKTARDNNNTFKNLNKKKKKRKSQNSKH